MNRIKAQKTIDIELKDLIENDIDSIIRIEVKQAENQFNKKESIEDGKTQLKPQLNLR